MAVQDKDKLVSLEDLKTAYDDLDGDISDLKNTLNHKADAIYDTASGDIASFPDGADGLPVKDLTVAIEPVQDLHGYEYPWPAGSGKNLFGGSYNELFELHIPSGTTVCAYCDNTATINYYGADGQTRIDYWTVSSAGRVFTLTADAYYFRFNGASEGATPTKMYVAIESAFSGYLPYANICPISGWTGCNVTRTGINIWDEEWESGAYDVDTGEKVSGSTIRSKNYVPVHPNTSYFCYNGSYSGAGNTIVVCYDRNKNFIVGKGESGTNRFRAGNTIFTTPDNCYYINFYSAGTTYNNDISINYPATDHDYHPGHVQTIPISWQSEAGTVYGGTLDVTTGVLTVTDANIASYNGETLPGEWISDRDAYSAGATPTTGAQVVYELAQPQTYQLDPVTLTTLLGQNNVWADCGSVEVEAPRDTRLYIDRKISEAVTNLLNA